MYICRYIFILHVLHGMSGFNDVCKHTSSSGASVPDSTTYPTTYPQLWRSIPHRVPVCVGCSVVAEGKMVERPLSGTPPVEMAASSVTLLGTCNTKVSIWSTYTAYFVGFSAFFHILYYYSFTFLILQEYPFKRGEVHGMEYLRRFPHLRPKTGVFSRLLRLRNAATMAVHRFFQDRGFVNVHTPIITSSDCEGAGELFEIRVSS